MGNAPLRVDKDLISLKILSKRNCKEIDKKLSEAGAVTGRLSYRIYNPNPKVQLNYSPEMTRKVSRLPSSNVEDT